MIAKLTTGNGFSGALKYDLRDGKLMEMKRALPEQIRVLDAKDVCFDYDDEGNMVLDVKQVAWDFRQQAMAYGGRNPIEKPVYHWALSYHPDDAVTDEQMLEDTEEFLDRMGFSNTQYVVTAHRDRENPHVHVIANIVDNDAKRISTYKMIDKAHQVAADITKKRGYTWGEKATKKTIENAHKPHEKVRLMIEPVIKKAVLDSVSFEQLEKKLAKYSITCNIKEAKDGKRGGISFGYEYKGQLHTFKGSAVDRQLSFAAINRTFGFNKNSLLYIVHSRTDASVFSLDPNYSYRDMEPLRQALVDRGYMVAGIQGKDEYDRQIELQKKYKADFRIGHIYRQGDKISFNKEVISGDPEITAPAFAQQEQSTLAPEPTPAPALAPAPKPKLQPKPRPASPSVVSTISKLKGLKTANPNTSKKKDDDDKKKPGLKI